MIGAWKLIIGTSTAIECLATDFDNSSLFRCFVFMPVTLFSVPGETMSGMSSPCHGRRGGAVRDHLAVGPGHGLHRRHSLRNSRNAGQTPQDLTEVRKSRISYFTS